MSSRVMLPGDSGPYERVAWRQVGADSAAPAVPAPPGKSWEAEALDQLRAECERRVAEARGAGRREGESEALNHARAEMQAALDRMAASIEEMAALRSRLRREAEADTVKLALAIARRVIRRELAVDSDALHGLVMAALEKLQAQEICRVRVHPAQVSAIAALLRRSVAGATIEVVADGSRDPGAAVFETGRGNLDASVEAQLGEIERGLADALGRTQA